MNVGQTFKGRILSLDGLRGLAILMVLVGHFNGEEVLKLHWPVIGPLFTKIALAGLTGVDLFFVLSGFLITGILVDSKGAAHYFRSFYARRFLRIFPLYYGVLFFVLWVCPLFIKFDPAAVSLSANQVWLWTYLTNFPGSGQWDSSGIIKLGHFWSLAVEEHFYLVWPAVIFLFERRSLKRISILWALMSFSAGLLSTFHSQSFWVLKWSTITHSGGLALGAFCALAIRDNGGLERLIPMARRGIYLWGGLFVILTLVPRRIFNSTTSDAMSSVSSLFFASLLILTLAARPGSVVEKLFTNRMMTTFGKVSYGLYVYHGILRPVFERMFPRETLMTMLQLPFLGIIAYFFLATGVTFMISFLSWHLYEKQFLKLKRFFGYGDYCEVKNLAADKCK
jgi:peptidoglycan/LPS O-acetylase OafA/YrhL